MLEYEQEELQESDEAWEKHEEEILKDEEEAEQYFEEIEVEKRNYWKNKETYRVKNKEDQELVELTPIEYDSYRKRYIRWYPDKEKRWFSKGLTEEKLEEAISKIRVQKIPRITSNPNNFLFYEYPSKPEMILNLGNGKIYVRKDTIKLHGKQTCRHQASILLRILKKFKLTQAKRGKPVSSKKLKCGKDWAKKRRKIFTHYPTDTGS